MKNIRNLWIYINIRATNNNIFFLFINNNHPERPSVASPVWNAGEVAREVEREVAREVEREVEREAKRQVKPIKPIKPIKSIKSIKPIKPIKSWASSIEY
jgi:hypothetical protein